MDQLTTVYILAIYNEHTWRWSPLSATPTTFFANYSVQFIVAEPPTGGDRPVFSAVAHGDRCLVTWLAPSVPAPFPVDGPRTELAHGARLDFPDRAYVVWVGPGSWSDADAEADRQVLSELGALTGAELDSAAWGFLTLPYVRDWWDGEFALRTGFVQCRDGRFPQVTRCEVAPADGGYELRCGVAIWDMSRGWEGGEETFAHPLRGADLVALRECAALPAPPPRTPPPFEDR